MRLKNKDVILVPVVVIAGKIVSFVFNAILGAYYGAGKISDAFLMAHSIPTILFDGVATAFISCYIPIYSSLKYESPEKIDDFNSNMTSISFSVSLSITLIYFTFHEQINRLYAKGFDDESLNLFNAYSEILVWSIPFIGAYAILRGHLQVLGKKAVSSIGQVVCYMLLIVSVILFFPNDKAISWATLAGNILCFFLFLVFAIKTGYRYRVYISFKETYIKSFLLMIFPIFFSTLVSELASIVDKFFASQHSSGIITSLTNGYQLSFSIQGIISASLLIVVFPVLADKAARKDEIGVNNVVYTCVNTVCWAVFPLVVGGILLSEPIIAILFGHGKYSVQSTKITALIFSGYLLGVLPMCIKHIGDRTCYALKKTNYSMITTFITVGMNIVLDYVMNKIWGYMGLVIATSISILLGSITTIVLIKRKNRSLSYKRIMHSFLCPGICSLIMGIVIYLLKLFVSRYSINNILLLILSISLGVVVYIGAAFLLFRKHLYEVIRSFKK